MPESMERRPAEQSTIAVHPVWLDATGMCTIRKRSGKSTARRSSQENFDAMAEETLRTGGAGCSRFPARQNPCNVI
jgi:hypothetical protein